MCVESPNYECVSGNVDRSTLSTSRSDQHEICVRVHQGVSWRAFLCTIHFSHILSHYYGLRHLNYGMQHVFFAFNIRNNTYINRNSINCFIEAFYLSLEANIVFYHFLCVSLRNVLRNNWLLHALKTFFILSASAACVHYYSLKY
jgi:hypothetical protein